MDTTEQMSLLVSCAACDVTFVTVVDREAVERIRRCGECGAPALEVVADTAAEPDRFQRPARIPHRSY